MAWTRSNHADEAGVTRLSAPNEAKFRAWAVAQGITDVDHPENGVDYRAYWLRYAQEGATGDGERVERDEESTGSSTGGRWVARTFLGGRRSQLEAALLKRHRGTRG